MRRLCAILIALCLLTACAQQAPRVTSTAAPTEPPEVRWEYGSISSKRGEDRNVEQGMCLRTAGFLALAHYVGALPDTDYAINWFAYDAQHQFLGGRATALGSGVGISADQIREQYPEAAYFRLILRSAYTNGTVELTDKAPIRLFTAQEDWPGLPMAQEEIAGIGAFQNGGIQDGEAFDGKLFTFKDDGTGNVYDVHTGEFLDGFVLGGRDKLMPHVNSASFSDQYYEAGDAYPLLYTSMYNNLTPQNRQLLATCCVYRITETAGEFEAQLVQMIWISFSSDRQLWLSPQSNERPYGNFVVDTDRDLLYAFVPRDDSQTTRFFAFGLPKPNAGNYSSTYGCNLVVLNKEDIMRQFDVGYFSSPQGCCYTDGKIISVEGFGSFNTVPPFLRVVDLESGLVEQSVNLGQLGLEREPETITVSDGQICYVSADMVLRKLWFVEQ